MSFDLKVDPQVLSFLENLDKGLKESCEESIELLRENPFKKRPKCDIKKLSGKKDEYRLRIGKARFEYTIYKQKRIILVNEAFWRGRGYL